MKYKKVIMIVLSMVVVIFGACTVGSGAQIELDKDYYDFGDIKLSDGIITQTFYIKNTGTETLEIYGVPTSCGCTKAKVNSNKVEPGEQTELVVTYDPSVHPDLRGSFKRLVYIKSNDFMNEELALTLVGNAVAEGGKS